MIFNPVSSGTPLPELTNPGQASDLMNGRQLIGPDGEIITGSMPTVVQATPGISVSSSGLITASASQSAGYVVGGSKSATRQLTTQAGTTITPGTATQTAVSSGRYTTGNVMVAGDPDLIPGNIRSGVNIFGVTGTFTGSNVITRTTFNNLQAANVKVVGNQNVATFYVSTNIPQSKFIAVSTYIAAYMMGDAFIAAIRGGGGMVAYGDTSNSTGTVSPNEVSVAVYNDPITMVQVRWDIAATYLPDGSYGVNYGFTIYYLV